MQEQADIDTSIIRILYIRLYMRPEIAYRVAWIKYQYRRKELAPHALCRTLWADGRDEDG